MREDRRKGASGDAGDADHRSDGSGNSGEKRRVTIGRFRHDDPRHHLFFDRHVVVRLWLRDPRRNARRKERGCSFYGDGHDDLDGPGVHRWSPPASVRTADLRHLVFSGMDVRRMDWRSDLGGLAYQAGVMLDRSSIIALAGFLPASISAFDCDFHSLTGGQLLGPCWTALITALLP